jgi:hypothetical protein
MIGFIRLVLEYTRTEANARLQLRHEDRTLTIEL